MKTAAIVITYNRLDLLKECISGIKNQLEKPEEIIIIDNSSNDGTSEWLDEQSGLTVMTQENTGCSGGMHTALQYAYAKGFDWFWLMDDDTIPYPDTLSVLHKNIADLQQTGVGSVGFIGSKAIWKDGTPHLMNVPYISTFDYAGSPFNLYDKLDLLSISSSSFVSLMVSRPALAKAGLPIKEFYIWCDDVEFTKRIVSKGFLGFYSARSVVLHNTKINYGTNIYTDELANIWKYRYGIRNELYMVRYFNGRMKYLSKVLKRLLIFPFRIFLKRKNHRFAFIKVNFQSTLSSIFFNPKPDRV